MKEQYKNTFIYNVCETLNMDLKELALEMSKTLKCIEVWRKDESKIPAKEKKYMKLLMFNKELENKIISMSKQTVEHSTLTSSILGEVDLLDLNKTLITDLRPKSRYKIILQEL